MAEFDFDILKEKFSAYADGFIAESEDPGPFLLKKEHTFRVCRNIRRIAAGIDCCSKDLLPAETAALFHDIGRFRQFREYGTFVDAVSENHALLSCRVIDENNLLDGYGAEEKKRIKDAVFYHNMYAPPNGIDDSTLLLTRLLRDADKLDILDVVTRRYLSGDNEQSNYVILYLTDDGKVSPALLEDLFEKRVITGSKVERLNDLKLLQISWIFDLNFDASIQTTITNGYMEKIFSTMPQSDDLIHAKSFIDSYISEKIHRQ
ncbi:MAG: HD domain-containing protein [Desulfarculaceae bacterium]|nr:HD domain-containing protein [Desulfarculaceae bacterium]